MKLRKIYWVKQKFVGLLVLLATLIFWDSFIKYDAAILMVFSIPIGVYLLFSKRMFFDSDYIFEFR